MVKLFASASVMPNIPASECTYFTRFRLVNDIFKLPLHSYYTYPHASGFVDSRTCVIAGKIDGNSAIEYSSFDLSTRKSSPLLNIPNARMYYAVANGRMVVSLEDGLGLYDLHQGTYSRAVDWRGWKSLSDVDISPSGGYALATRFPLDGRSEWRVEKIDLLTGDVETVVTASSELDHAHFSPYDASWICFGYAGKNDLYKIGVWHAAYAPNGRPLFNPVRPDGRLFKVGHNRAMFDRRALLAVVYGDSSAQPTGLFVVPFDGEVTLISQSHRDYHCNASHDGSWAVVSSLGPADTDKLGYSLCRPPDRNWTASDVGWVYSDIFAVSMATGHREFLYRATNRVALGKSLQPYEPQPAISPDGRWVLVKDASNSCVVAVEINQQELRKFCSPFK